MTSNHLLLYHLAELMLENEQHVLPVDLLFDDEQIGDFAKSIQIDSPYQQMLLEGVLTESVRDEKLYVSFTVEGYFHYVLGEVIHDQAENKGAEFLRGIIETNHLKGTVEGVEQCLVRDVEQDDLARLMQLIDMGEQCTEASVKALMQGFVRIKSSAEHMANSQGKDKERAEARKAFLDAARINTDRILKELFSDYSVRDVNVLDKVIEVLDKISSERTQMVKSTIFSALISVAKPDRPEIYELALKGYTSVDTETLRKLLLEIEKSMGSFNERKDRYAFLSDLGVCYRHLGDYEKAIETLKSAFNVLPEDMMTDKIKILGRIGSAYGDWAIKTHKTDFGLKSVEYCRLALELEKKAHSEDTVQKAIQMNNLAKAILTFFMKRWPNEFSEKEIELLFRDALEMIERLRGPYSALMGGGLNNLSMLYATAGKTEKALEVALKAYAVVEKVYSHNDHRKALMAFNIANRYEQLNELENAVTYYKVSVEIDQHLGLLAKNKNTLQALIRCLRQLNDEDEAAKYKEMYNSFRN